MIASFDSALKAAGEAAGSQDYPKSTLYVVATPIGNLADISLRALHVLSLADHIACEDTRHTRSMLRAYGIDTATSQLLALHQHNEAQAAGVVIDLLRQGARVACVSDAGTPGISDPGARLVAQVREQGLRVLPLPGASSVTALLSAAGAVQTGESDSGFVFAGFLPSKTGERAQALQALAAQTRAFVLLEAPHRMQALALALSSLGERTLTVGRELSKQFEEIASMRADTLVSWLATDPQRLRGEFTLVVHAPHAQVDAAQDDRILRLLLAEMPLKTAVKLAADISGESRNALYERALALKHADDLSR